METDRQTAIFNIIFEYQPIGISAILEKIRNPISLPTLNRELAALKASDFISVQGRGPGTKYVVNKMGLLQAQINPDTFFKIDIDNRKIVERYNHFIFDLLSGSPLFSDQETALLKNATERYQRKIEVSGPVNYKREFERLMIELSWKSSQIEGNTYDLLDTEQLLKYAIKAPNHTAEETQMLLNHKTAIEYTREYAELFDTLTVSKIIDIHSLLTKGMGISKGIRSRIVRITGTKYTPPDNQFVIGEVLERLCTIINSKASYYEKALLAVLMISYIQPFEDGNKRTARLTGNALLMNAGMCPLSYRSVSPAEYKKAVLLFYELNNLTAFKKIFITQYQFAVENYF